MKRFFCSKTKYRSSVSKACFFLLSFLLLDLAIFSTAQKPQLSRQEYYVFADLARPFKQLSLFKLSQIDKNDIEQKIIGSVPFSLRPHLKEILSMTLRLSEWYGIDPFWILAIMWTESAYRPHSVSEKGAIGLMQLLPSSFTYVEANKKNPFFSVFHDSGPWYLGQTQKFPRWGRGVWEKRIFLSASSPCAGEGPHWSIATLLRPELYPMRTHLRDPLTNIESGILYLRCLLDTFDQDPHLATMAYNMGPGNLRGKLNKQKKGTDPAAEWLQMQNQYLKKVQRAYQLLTYSFPHQSS